MRAGFRLFASVLSKRADGLRREIERLGALLGAVRDLDVQLEQLAAWRAEAPLSDASAFDAIEKLLRQRRAAARRRLIATLETARYERFTGRLCAFLRHGPSRLPALGRTPAQSLAPELIGLRYRAVRKVGDGLNVASPSSAFHALRIRTRRLRYALEFHWPLYDGDVAAMVESLTALQDLLGEHQDAFVAIGHLEELSALGSRKLPPRALFLMGTIAARYGQRAEALRRAFPKAFRKIRGRRWKALKATLAGGAG
jgi:CHAD domain-containing protein